MRPRHMSDPCVTWVNRVGLPAGKQYTDAGELIDHPSQPGVGKAAFIPGHWVPTPDVAVRAGEKYLLHIRRRIPQSRGEIVALLIERHGMKTHGHFFTELCIAKSERIHAAVASELRDTKSTHRVPHSDSGNIIDLNEIGILQRVSREKTRQITG